ncbi:MAG: hypothetical protein LBL25_01695, partial [Oscillospiraceae bacterium]|nr:hypothetical protein [Oscillospiraceae bacterium]
MKRILAALLIVLTAPAAMAYAAGVNDAPDESSTELFEEQSDAAGVKSLEKAAPDAAGEILGDMKVTDALDPEGVISRLISGVTRKLREIAASSMKGAAAVAAAALLSGIFSSALPGGSGNYAKLSGVLAVSAASVSSVHTFIGMGDEVLRELG